MTARDRRLLDLAYEVGRAESLDDLRHLVTFGAASVVGCDLAGYNEVDLTRRTARVLLDQEVPDYDSILTSFERLAYQHPLITRPVNDAETISDYLTWPEFRSTELYDEVFRLLSARDVLAITVHRNTMMIGLALNRPRATFGRRDREALDGLAPMIRRGLRHVEARERGQRLLRSLTGELDRDTIGVVALAPHGEIDYASDHARSMLRRYFRERPCSRLPDTVVRWLESDPAARLQTLRVERADGRLEICAAIAEPGDWMLLELREWPRFTDHRVTAREREILGLVARGRSNHDIAAELGLSRRTVEHHLQAAYRKLGVTNRSAAVARLRDGG